MMLSPSLRKSVIESCNNPQFDEKELNHVIKHIKNMKTTSRGLSAALTHLKEVTGKDEATITSVSILKFIIKKHLEQSHLFESSFVNSFSESGYITRFWGPLVEKVFRHSSVIPHGGDTIPGSLLAVGVKMKMDLRLIAVSNSEPLDDHSYGEFARKCSISKYFKDKRKAVIASKTLLNSIIQQNSINQTKDCIFIPYLIAMGFDMHLCVLFLKSNKLYITKKIKTITFPSSFEDFANEFIGVVDGLLDLVTLCEAIKKQSCRGKKRKSIDSLINDISGSSEVNTTLISKIIWDRVKKGDFEDEEEEDNDENENYEEEDDKDDEEKDDDEDEEDDEDEVEDQQYSICYIQGRI